MIKPKTILFFSPHYDDETISAGATIVKMVSQGHKVVVIPFTGSEMAYSSEDSRLVEREQHLLNGRDACKILGASYDERYLKQEDMNIGTGQLTQLLMIRSIRDYHADIVMTVHHNDWHCDHRALAIASKEAVSQAGRCGIAGYDTEMKEAILLLGEVDLERLTVMNYNVYSEVTKEQVEKKIEALKCFRAIGDEHSGIFGKDHGENWCWSIARMRGFQAGVEFAEAFEVGNLNPKFTVENVLSL